MVSAILPWQRDASDLVDAVGGGVMMAMACERVAAESLPAVMCVDDRGAALFATNEAHRLCDRWNAGLHSVEKPLLERDFRLPDAVGGLLDTVTREGRSISARRLQPVGTGLRLRHPSLPELAVTMELGGYVKGMQGVYCMLVFADEVMEEQPLSDISPERHKALEQLTPSERRVALLVTEGMRNSEIADHLHRSRRTIEYQLNAIYRKLDLSSRTQLVRALA